ncbi:hypothetical protein MMC24_003771 [Lignoscripta atroalba]|nr:hypothetical protein [Lignoscripta atroalba]
MSQPDMTQSFTKTFHKKPYPAISPTQPSLSVAGRTVLITGGSQGIGLAITNAYAAAGASHIIVVARREGPLAETKKSIEHAYPSTTVHTYAATITEPDKIQSVFSSVRSEIGEPDILILCAGFVNRRSPALATPLTEIRQCYEINVIANMNIVHNFLSPQASTKDEEEKKKIIINISTAAAHMYSPGIGAYGASKGAFVQMLAHIQNETPGLRVHDLQPGMVYTQMVRDSGFGENDAPWDNVDLPGQTALWLASPEAAFLAGRFVWSNWDVEELKARADEIGKSQHLLKIGLIGEPAGPVRF